ncbi:heme/hemin ABC transporter substrate-binding protein [Methylobacterium brachythecii]|uniref:Hemin ABC transporter substrate-binding protein n=1 Tax=Methylobacterium brachythecii TaxID=1176177 RepID=A0A7W6AFX4_9HYPH|nr:ABC transporter substrate-binding protein [Methylobacterium brachythecii]MBB3900735.1 iron complex transport system substrate-binding protein [Methylobacterium brachythecii]GLS46595.1 hemin ABC transporter substrate-binding protein [Methylobacterium brachythecii]
MTRSPTSRRAVLAGLLASAGLPRIAGAAEIAPTGARRIASLGGAVTETLYRLGAADRIVAVDTTSLFPAEAMREKPNVGYLRALSAEGLLSTRPDIVVAAEGAGPPDVLALVREAGVPISLIKEPPTPEGVLDKITTIGRIVGLEDQAAGLAKEIGARFAKLGGTRAGIKSPAKALVILSLANGRIMVGGRNSSADGILTLAGLQNAASEIEGFKPMSDEAIVAAAPDAVVMMRNGPEAPGRDAVFAPGTVLGRTPAAQKGRLVAMDGLYLLGFGPRTPDAARELMRAVYPDLAHD